MSSVRNSGRTTRMLRKAIQYALLGRNVYIVIGTEHQRDGLKEWLKTLIKDFTIDGQPLTDEGRQNVERRITFATDAGQIAWYPELRVTRSGFDSNTVVLADHYAAEVHAVGLRRELAAVEQLAHMYNVQR